MIDMDMGIGQFIIRRRDELNLTQTALAEMVGLKRSHLSLIESGKIALPGASVRREIARVLGVRHVDLLVIAGELDPDEIDGSTVPLPDDSRVAEFVSLLPYVDDIVMGALRRMTVGANAQAGQSVRTG